jgi:hypothetical protein
MHKYFFIYLEKSKWLRTTGFVQVFIYLFQLWHVCKKKKKKKKKKGYKNNKMFNDFQKFELVVSIREEHQIEA